MFRSFRDTDRSYGLRPRVGHGSTGSSPSGSPCPPVSSRSRGGRPCPVTGSGHQDPQLSRAWPAPRTVVRSQGPGASAPQPVGASGQLGKEQALPCAENLFSWCGVDSVSMTARLTEERAQSVLNCLSSFRGRTVAPLKLFQRLLGHMASVAAVTPLGLLHMRPLQHWLHSRVPRWGRRGALRVNITQAPSAPGRTLLSTGRGALRTSVSACCCHNRCLQHGLGRYMQRAGSLGALDGASTALAHQLPRAAGSASSLAAVSATAVRQACVGPYGQHCGCVVHQPDGGYTITPHVTARPPSPPLESHAAQVAERCPYSGGAQSCGRCALTTAHFPGEWRLHPETIRLIQSIRGSSGRPVCFPRVLPLPAVFLPDRGHPRHGRAGTQLASGSMQVCISPSEPARTDTVQSQGGRGAGPAGRAVLAQTWFPELILLATAPPWPIPLRKDSFLRGSAPFGTRVQTCGTSMCGSWMGRGRLEWSPTGGGRDHHSG